MKKRLILFALAVIMVFTLASCSGKTQANLIQFEEPKEGQPIVTMTIADYGDIKMVLYPEQAPKTVENFITLSEEGYYDGVVFHRVINNFMIQGGDPTATGAGGKSIWNKPFEDEFSDDLYCFRGALCMANSGANTNGSQFFIVQSADTDPLLIDQALADGNGRTDFPENVKEKYAEVGGTPWLDGAHTVFGQVLEGMDVVDNIAATETDANSKPISRVTIEKITVDRNGYEIELE